MPNQSDKEFNGCQNDTFEPTQSFTMSVKVKDMNHLQLSKSDTELFQTMATVIRNGDEYYYHLPQFFKKEDNDVYEVLYENELPNEVKDLYFDCIPKAVNPLPDGGNYVDLGLIRNEVKRINALGINTDGLLDLLVRAVKEQNKTIEYL